MKRTLLEKPYMPFLITAFIVAMVAVIFKIFFPFQKLDVSIYNHDYSISQFISWMIFAGYLFFLSAVYYFIKRFHLKTNRRLILFHYIFITLFLLFYSIFSLFSSPPVQRVLSGLPLSTLITVYGIIFLADVGFFIFGLVFLFINLFSVKRDKHLK